MPIDGPNQKLSFAQLESLWVQAGGNKKLAPTMAAIALAESGGNTGNHNPNAATGDDSYGLWQINYFGANRAPRTARWGPPQAMYNPVANARAAVDLAGATGSGLSNWSTYKNGAYLSHLGSKQAGVGAGIMGDLKGILTWNPPFLPKNPASQAGSDVGGAINTTIHDTTSFFKALPYALATFGGFLLLILAIALVGADIGISQLNSTPTRLVRSRLPRGRTQRSAASHDSANAAEEERRQRREERESQMHEARLKTEKAKATELRTRTKHRRRNKQQQEAEVKKAYIHGARDAR